MLRPKPPSSRGVGGAESAVQKFRMYYKSEVRIKYLHVAYRIRVKSKIDVFMQSDSRY